MNALRDAIATTRIRIRDEHRALRLVRVGSFDYVTAQHALARYLRLQRAQVAALREVKQ